MIPRSRSDVPVAAAIKRDPLRVDGRRVLLSRGREKVEVAIAFSPPVAQRIRACLSAMSGLDPRAPRLRRSRRPRPFSPGTVQHILLAADKLAAAIEAAQERTGRPMRRELRVLVARFWSLRVQIIARPLGEPDDEHEIEKQPREPPGRWG